MATITFAVGILADLGNSKTLFKVKNGLVLVAAPVSSLLWEDTDIGRSRL
jgi:hypothetical protein